MVDYKSMYYNLLNQLSDVIEELKKIQCNAEELYIKVNSDDENK